MATAPPFRSMVDKTRKDRKEEPLEYYALTGLTTGQLHKLTLLVMQEIGSLVKAGAKKPPAVGLLDSVVMVVMLMRRNATQAAAAAHFHCSQPAVGPAAPGNRQGSRPLCPRSRPGARPRGNCPGRRHRLPGMGLERNPGPVFREGQVHGNERADRVQSQGRRGRYRPGSRARRTARCTRG